MDSFQMLPTITMSELRDRAAGFAKHLAEQLEKLNRDSHAVLPPEAQKYVEGVPDEQILRPTPFEYQSLFESVFCRYIASHYIIIPDEP
jgi:hypothetical protein